MRDVSVVRADVHAAQEAVARGSRKQRSYYLSEELLARVNAAVYWARSAVLPKVQAGEDVDMREVPDRTSYLVERALWAEVIYIERLLNEGEPFPPAPGPLPTGPGQNGRDRLSRRQVG